MTESQWDKLLHIKTTGRDDSHSDQYRYPYEPTPYSVLERLANRGYIRKDNTLIDYGCGKGRVSFYFFNPFSAEILKKVMARIRESYDGREILLFFYYPSDEYIAWLMTVEDLMFVDEIDCGDLFDGNNSREQIMIFEFGY